MPAYGDYDNEEEVKIFHYNQKTEEYKTFRINPVPGSSGVFVTMMAGKKGEDPDKITFKMEENELAAIIMGAEKLYRKL